jgi:hypothetical protein
MMTEMEINMKTRTLYILLAILALGDALLIRAYDPSVEPNVTVFTCAAIFIACAIAMVPTIVANRRRHHNAKAIFWTNLLLGWTGIGWIVSFIWAMTDPRQNVEDMREAMAPRPAKSHAKTAALDYGEKAIP